MRVSFARLLAVHKISLKFTTVASTKPLCGVLIRTAHVTYSLSVISNQRLMNKTTT